MGIIQRILGLLLGLIFIAGVFVFASLAIGVILAVGLVVWGWLWWRGDRTRVRFTFNRRKGVVVEGEYRDVTTNAERIVRRDPP